MTDKRFDDGPFLTLAEYGSPLNLGDAAPMIEALQRIVRARDYNAEHGEYPPEYEIVAFDDWAADIADTVLSQYRVFLPPSTTKE